VFPCGQTDLTKLMAAFRNFASASKNKYKYLKFQKIFGEAVKP
jgi:hypothetical protein